MAYFKVPGGEFMVDSQDFTIERDQLGRPVLVPLGGGGGAAGVTSVNGKRGNVTLTADDIPAGANSQQFTNADKTELNQATTDITNLKTSVNNKFDKSGGTMTGDINMGSHGITNVEKIAINGNNPLFIGSVVEPTSEAPRMTATNDGKMAFVKANTQNTYVAVSVGEPQSANDAATKAYVDAAIAGAGGLPPSAAADANKVLTVNAQGVAEWQSAPSGTFLITIAGGTGNLSADKTFTEITNAIKANKPVLVYYAHTYYQLQYVNDDEIRFARPGDTYVETLTFLPANTVTAGIYRFIKNEATGADIGKFLTLDVATQPVWTDTIDAGNL